MPKREVGIVRWYDRNEGCGFIARRQGEDIYVHCSSIVCNGKGSVLKEGDPVEFTVVEAEDGLHAQEVIVKK